MTNARKEATLRYTTEREPGIKEVQIGENDTPHSVLLKIKAPQNFHFTDDGGHLFALEDNLFGYCTVATNPPLKLLHGSALLTRKTRALTPKKDNRICVEVQIGDDKTTFARGLQKTYAKILKDVKEYWGKTDPVHILRVRAVDDRIIVECSPDVPALWFTGKACPPLKLEDDKLYKEAIGTGGWGSIPLPQPMITRSKAATAQKKPKKMEVMLHNIATQDLEKIGETDDYDKALELARNSGKIPKNWNFGITDANDERIIISFTKAALYCGFKPPSPPVTATKAKAKKSPVLPEKIVGPSPASPFAPKTPPPEVPGILNFAVDPKTFKDAIIRPITPQVGSWRIEGQVLGEPEKGIVLRKDFLPTELFATFFHDTVFTEHERVKIVVKPLKLEDGAKYKFEKVSTITRIALTVHIWDGGISRCGIEIFPSATLSEIVSKAQEKIDDEHLEKAECYTILHKGNPASAPWIQKEYELIPATDSTTVIVKGKFGTMTAAVPLNQPERWQRIVYDILPNPPLAVTQTVPKEFQAVFEDEEILTHVRFFTDDMGEEHIVPLLPLWENQHLRIRHAFGREMIPDESHPSKDNVLYVKSADGSPPDPTFDRLMTYTLGDESEEHQVRVHKGTTTQEVKAEISRLHSGYRPEKILFEGSEMTDEDPVTDWATTTGTSPLKVQITLGAPVQRLLLWRTSGFKDLGEIELDGRPRDEIWRDLQHRNTCLTAIEDYRLYQGQDRIRWEDLPCPNVARVPKIIPCLSRGASFAKIDHHQVPRFREVGPLTQMSFQLFTMENTAVTELIVITAPNEITLAQLVTYLILSLDLEFDVDSVFYWNLLRIRDESSSNPDKTTVQEIPDKIPVGFTLRVKCSSPHDNSDKKMAHCRWEGIVMPFQMHQNDTVERLKRRMAEWMRLQGQGSDWTIDRPDREAIDFECTYDIVPAVVEVPATIFLKQIEIHTAQSVSWISLSDQIVKSKKLPKGTLSRIYPVVGTVDNQDAEDFSYDITWEEGKQYWYDIVHDPRRDMNGKSKQITMIDHAGHAETFVVPVNASAQKIVDLWRTTLEAPPNVGIFIISGNGDKYHWGYSSQEKTVSYSIITPTKRWDVSIYPGVTQFEADQLSRLLEIKTPPLVRAHRINRHANAIIQFDDEPTLLSSRLIGTHLFSWDLEGSIIRDVIPMDLWVPYDLGQIMRRGHSVNSSIPEDISQVEFPDFPWGDEVTIRIKSQNSPPIASIPTPSSDPQRLIAPPSSWQGPALGQAPAISTDAADLTGYTSPNAGQDGATLGDLPPDPDLQVFRGLS
jgi:hypothetical protein